MYTDLKKTLTAIGRCLPDEGELTQKQPAISEAARQDPLPYFEKAFVTIRIVTPRGSHNARVWDTSNRAIQIILNNPKGIFFEDDNIEHMAFSVIGSWGAGREYGDPGLRFRQIAAA